MNSVSELDNKARTKKWLRRLAIVGGLLGLLCSSLPADYRVICDTIASVCTLGLG